ncbi:MAG TPA: hypothetical protein PK523_11515 [Elusimicrobiales bacterium]|nr:hypothetical protein [Elusimicrobiales bacterium]
MPVKLKLLKRGEDRMTYSLPSLKMLSEKLVDSMEWPADKQILAFRFPPSRAPKGVPIKDMISRRKYLCRTTYVGKKRDIPAVNANGCKCGLKLASFRSRGEFRKTFLGTHEKYFIKAFRDYQEAGYKQENKKFFEKYFPSTKGISVRKDRKIVGILCEMTIPKDGGKAYRPMSWLCWVWVDGRLSKEERKASHNMLGGWIKKLPGKYFGAAIHAVNLKSQNWMLKMGARPVQVFFLRR